MILDLFAESKVLGFAKTFIFNLFLSLHRKYFHICSRPLNAGNYRDNYRLKWVVDCCRESLSKTMILGGLMKARFLTEIRIYRQINLYIFVL